MKKHSTAGEFSDAFPASPRRPPVVCIYITHEERPKVLNTINFSALYAATQFIKECIELHGLPDADGNDLIFESGWRLSTRNNSQENNLLAISKGKSREGFYIPPESYPPIS